MAVFCNVDPMAFITLVLSTEQSATAGPSSSSFGHSGHAYLRLWRSQSDF